MEAIFQPLGGIVLIGSMIWLLVVMGTSADPKFIKSLIPWTIIGFVILFYWTLWHYPKKMLPPLICFVIAPYIMGIH